ncbi:MAG: linear amide C-N hydrolase [Gloeomargarita sp. DG02_3_bins_56]
MCTRVFWNTNPAVLLVGRSMDWPTSTQPKLYVFPRGIERDGGLLGSQRVVTAHAARWVSRYGSLVTAAYDLGAFDGCNEAGLAIHLLYLTATDYGSLSPNRPVLHAGIWGQFILDQAATVAEALALQAEYQLVKVRALGYDTNLHLALEDASGDSAIIEYLDGQPVIHHGRQFRVMTNDPTYDEQLTLLGQLDFANATRETPLPGNVDPISRFQRASFFLHYLRQTASVRQAVAKVLAIIRNCSVPFDAPYKAVGSIYNTEYRTVCDLTHRRYYFELADSPNLIWADLDYFDLAPGAPTLQLDPNDINWAANVSAAFTPCPNPF